MMKSFVLQAGEPGSAHSRETLGSSLCSHVVPVLFKILSHMQDRITVSISTFNGMNLHFISGSDIDSMHFGKIKMTRSLDQY